MDRTSRNAANQPIAACTGDHGRGVTSVGLGGNVESEARNIV